jgi:hypothetical protein
MSTTIIVEGDESLVTRDRRFVCPFCHAVFIADSESYALATLGEEGDTAALAYVGVKEDPGIEAFATCPTCGQKAISPSGSGGEVPTPVALVIQSRPVKQIYYIGDTFDPTGMVIGQRMSNGMIAVVDLSDCTFTPDLETALTLEDTLVSVAYGELEVDTSIVVRAPALAYPEIRGAKFSYTGSEQGPLITGYDPGTMTLAGNAATDVGDYVLTITPKPGCFWVDGSTEALVFPWQITKVYPTYTAPKGITGLIYSGEAQVLCEAGTVTGGTFMYRAAGISGTSEWSAELPTGKDVSNYRVEWRIDGDKNHWDLPASQRLRSFDVLIARAEPVLITAPAAVAGLSYTGEAQTLVTPGESTGGLFKYQISEPAEAATALSTELPTGVAPGTYLVHWLIAQDANYHAGTSGLVNVTIAPAS